MLDIERKLDEFPDKADDLENSSHHSNLWFNGIPEDGTINKMSGVSKDKIKTLVLLTLGINPETINIERAHKVGKKCSNHSQP